MKKKVKSYRAAIVFVLIEVFFYVRSQQTGMFSGDRFFFFFAVLWLAFLFFSISGGESLGPMRGLGTGRNNSGINLAMLAGESAERQFNKGLHRKNKEFRLPINYIYFGLFVLNVIGYIIVM